MIYLLYLDIVRDTSYINYRPLKKMIFLVKIRENCFIHSIKKYQLFIFQDQSTDFMTKGGPDPPLNLSLTVRYQRNNLLLILIYA